MFVVRLFMLLAALSTLGLTSLDIMKDHLGVDTDALLRSGGNVALAYIADWADRWSGWIANLSGNDPVSGSSEGYGTSSIDARSAAGKAGGNLVIQLGLAAGSLLIMWILIKLGRRKA